MVNAILAAVLSFLIPGLGKKGIIFFVIAIVLAGIASLIFRTWFAGIVNLLYSLFAAYDAYQMAQ